MAKTIAAMETIAVLMATHPCALTFSRGARTGTNTSAPGSITGCLLKKNNTFFVASTEPLAYCT